MVSGGGATSPRGGEGGAKKGAAAAGAAAGAGTGAGAGAGARAGAGALDRSTESIASCENSENADGDEADPDDGTAAKTSAQEGGEVDGVDNATAKAAGQEEDDEEEDGDGDGDGGTEQGQVVSEEEYCLYVRDADVEDYLRGLLWVVQMYQDGVCPDYSYR